MTKYLDYEGLKALKKEANKAYVHNQKGVITSELYANQSIWGEHVLKGTLFGYHFHPASISSRQLMNKCVTSSHIDDSVYEYISQKVINGAWVPVKAGRNSEGNIIEGAVAEGLNTRAIHRCSHAEGNNTVTAGYCSHAEGENTKAGGSSSHAEGENTLANGVGSHAEGKGVKVLCWYGHGEGAYNYDTGSFIRTLGVGNSESNRVNAEVVYVKQSNDGNGLPTPSDPKNGYKYLLGIGGYTGKDITEGMKSVQEVISDLESRIAILEAKVKS